MGILTSWRLAKAMRQLEHSDSKTRIAAIQNLATLGPDARPEIPRLCEHLQKETDATVRCAGVTALGSILEYAGATLAYSYMAAKLGRGVAPDRAADLQQLQRSAQLARAYLHTCESDADVKVREAAKAADRRILDGESEADEKKE